MDKASKKPGVGFGIMILKDNKVLVGKRHGDPRPQGYRKILNFFIQGRLFLY